VWALFDERYFRYLLDIIFQDLLKIIDKSKSYNETVSLA